MSWEFEEIDAGGPAQGLESLVVGIGRAPDHPRDCRGRGEPVAVEAASRGTRDGASRRIVRRRRRVRQSAQLALARGR